MAESEPAMISEAELKMLGSVPLKKDVTKNLLKKGEWRLDGIVFKDQKDWTVWLNGEQFTPTHLPAGIRIVDVCDESVQLSLDEEGAPVKILCLNYCVKLHA
ncbi:hypothetical protein ID47_11465 [Candidatus Paracaedibacter acanthamoebae]|uniref:Uncharacterized protein n=2 Tax=Candidatus Odyssella acanthamoebae TaxID=91604 RepID=A0A077AX92_9PROT|nr:hypothetical protein ID47_11465 [Candidatus Paracaedibacter acanthamoebae]